MATTMLIAEVSVTISSLAVGVIISALRVSVTKERCMSWIFKHLYRGYCLYFESIIITILKTV